MAQNMNIRHYHRHAFVWQLGVVGLAFGHGLFVEPYTWAVSIVLVALTFKALWLFAIWALKNDGRRMDMGWAVFAVLEWLTLLGLVSLAAGSPAWLLLAVAPLAWLAGARMGTDNASILISISLLIALLVGGAQTLLLLAEWLASGALLIAAAYLGERFQRSVDELRVSSLKVRQLRETLKKQRAHDPHTGIANRASAEIYLERLVTLGERAEIGLSVVVFEVAPSAMHSVISQLKTSIRQEDLLLRLSINQIAIALVGRENDPHDRVAQRLRVVVGLDRFYASEQRRQGESASAMLDRAQLTLGDAA